MASRKSTSKPSAAEPEVQDEVEIVAAPNGAASPHAENLMTTAAASGRLQTFVDAVRSSGVALMLAESGPYTVFAPTDRAFRRMPAAERDALLADTVRLGEVLRHHVVRGRVRAPKEDMPRGATSVDGDELTLTRKPDAYRVDNARLVLTNIRASNGVIHAIDRVLLPR